jgi:protoheme IX farnesyltransferase
VAVIELSAVHAFAITWRRYYELTKPKVVFLIVFTAMAGMLLATDGMVSLDTLVFGLLGIGLASSSGAAFNHVAEQRTDALMSRTCDRPLPSGSVNPWCALAFAALLGVVSMLLLALLVNGLTAALAAAALIGYAAVYTVFLKRATPQNIVWGGLAGAIPPLLGWTAVTNELQLHGLLLVLIVFFWTPPHFWPLAIHRRHEYARAGLPMLPVTHGVAYTKRMVLIYTVLLCGVSLLPFVTRMSGALYLAGALLLGGRYLWHAVKLYRSADDGHAMETFKYSLFYITALFLLLLVDHYR